MSAGAAPPRGRLPSAGDGNAPLQRAPCHDFKLPLGVLRCHRMPPVCCPYGLPRQQGGGSDSGFCSSSENQRGPLRFGSIRVCSDDFEVQGISKDEAISCACPMRGCSPPTCGSTPKRPNDEIGTAL